MKQRIKAWEPAVLRKTTGCGVMCPKIKKQLLLSPDVLFSAACPNMFINLIFKKNDIILLIDHKIRS